MANSLFALGNQAQWSVPITPALGRHRYKAPKFEGNLVYRIKRQFS